MAIGTLAAAGPASADTVVASGTQATNSPGWCVGTSFTVAQTFRPTASGRVVRATAVVGRFSSNRDTLVVKLRSAANGRVTGPVLATATTPALASGPQTYTVTFDAPASVVAGQSYALEVGATGSYCDLFTYAESVSSNPTGQRGSQYDGGRDIGERPGFGYSVTVAGQDPPSCAGDTLRAAFNTPADLVPTCTGTGLTYTLKSAPTRGTLGPIGADGRVRYTPATDSFGPDSFALTATDSQGQATTENVTVEVAKPAPPTCAGDATQVAFNTPGDATFSCEGTKLTYAVGDQPAHGTLGVLSGNRVRYAPNGGFVGDDRFTVVATDVAGQRVTGTVQVRVGGPGDVVENTNDQLTHQVAQGQFSLQAGERATRTLSCPSGMLATDGHALVQAVDQDRGTPADVRVGQASRTAPDTYTFALQNPTEGQAQGKLSVDCISPQTFLGGRLSVGAPLSRTVAVAGAAQTTLSCPDGTKAIAPGFAGEDPARAGAATLIASEPAAGGSAWRFALSSASARSVELSVSCLGYATDQGALLSSTTSTATATVGGPTAKSTAVGCPVGTVGLVGGSSAPSSLATLGQELQGRSRLFWLQNTGAGDASATLSVLCVGLTTRSTSSPVTTAGVASPEPPAPPAVATAAAPDPGASATVASRVRASALRSGLRVAVTVPAAGATVRIVAVDAGRTVGSVTRKVAGGTRTLALPVSKAARRRLGRAGHRTLKVQVTIGGRTITKVVRVTR